MSLNPAMVYRRTDRGLREVYEKSHQFTQSERLVLILLDGRLSVAALRDRLPSLDNERIERTLVKLEEAGLLEPAAAVELPSASPTEEVMRLQPDVVAQFLEQSDLDPITTSGALRDRRAEAAPATPAGAPATTPAIETIHGLDVVTTRNRATDGESVRSQAGALPGFRDFGWELPDSTSFAITTVNVPDRLDMQHERDRVDLAEHAQDRRRERLERWMKRVLVVVVVGVVGAVLNMVVQPLWDETSSDRLGQRLSEAFGRPVKLADAGFQLMPSPRLVLHGVDVAGEFGADRVTLMINWRDLWLALNGGPWAWGEVAVAPLELTSAQAMAALRTLSGTGAGLPQSISTVRFESIRVRDSRLMPGHYDATLRRGEAGRFGPLVVRQLDAGDGSMLIRFQPSTAERGTTQFALEARQWSAPIGPRARWNDVRATGRLRGNLLEVSDFMLGGYYGITTGTVYVAGDVEWVVTGVAEAGNIDVEAIFRSLDGASARGAAPPMQGTATLKLLVIGRGATAEEAVEASALAGPFDVRFAVLNGINLGMAATQGISASGTTRFTEFGGTVRASATGVRFDDTGGRAGAMIARANFTVAPDRSIAGDVRVDFDGRQVQAPLRVGLAGTATRPQFGR